MTSTLCHHTTMRHMIVFLVWIVSTSTLLVASVAFYTISQVKPSMFTAYSANKDSLNSHSSPPVESNYILRPEVLGAFSNEIIASDARPKILASFLKRYSCPLEPYDYYADQFVEIADRHNLDFRLLPAISMQESNCCKRIPDGSYNCWGFGIYGDKVTRFSSYEEGMERVAQTLEEKYVKQGLLEPEEIMSKYTPSSKGSWAAGVLHFMSVMKETTLRSQIQSRS